MHGPDPDLRAALRIEPVSHTTTATIPTAETGVGADERLRRALRRYLAGVTAALGVGPESSTLDLDVPASAYVALDDRLPAFPNRDLALLWDERYGWSAAIESRCGEDLIVVSYLDGDTVAPPSERIIRFVNGLRRGRDRLGRPDPPAVRAAGDHAALTEILSKAEILSNAATRSDDRPLIHAGNG